MARRETFATFWPEYLRDHARPATRAFHYAGTTLVFVLGAMALLTGRWQWAAAMPLAGYGFAWGAHLLVEHNRPATFRHPLWSFAADFRMWWLWLTGRLGPELRKADLATR